MKNLKPMKKIKTSRGTNTVRRIFTRLIAGKPVHTTWVSSRVELRDTLLKCGLTFWVNPRNMLLCENFVVLSDKTKFFSALTDRHKKIFTTATGLLALEIL